MSNTPFVKKVEGGYCICADSTVRGVRAYVRDLVGDVPLVIADPPYGNIVSDKWDKINTSDIEFADWMVDWTTSWSELLLSGGAFYVWGGIGRPGFRPFFRYIPETEHLGLELSTLITWKKRRAYGIQWGYLFCREELAYFVKGDAKKPRCFNVPLLEKERGYEGYNKDYPAKSKYLRRTNVWDDVTEIFKGKLHTAQKPQRLHEIIIETHTAPNEYVLDIFAGSGVTAHAARNLGRRFVVIEKDEKTFESMVERLRND